MSSVLQRLNQDLFIAIEGMGISGANAYVRCVCVRKAEGVHVVGMQIHVGPDIGRHAVREVVTTNVLAFGFHVDEVGMTARTWIERIFDGELVAPIGTFKIIRRKGGLANYDGILDDAAPLGSQQRWMVLKVPYVSDPPILTDAINWELRAHTVPYDGFSDLLGDFGLFGMAEQFQAVVSILSAIDAESSIDGTTATIRVRMAEGLSSAEFRLGYKVISRSGVEDRSNLVGEAFRWQHEQGTTYSTGVATFEVPASSTLHCYAVYKGRAFHHWWVGDPKAPHNKARGILQLYDEDLGKLRKWIEPGAKRGNSRSLEAAVGTIFWMAGFSALHLGANADSSDAPDVIAVTPGGHVVVIECTRGGLKTDAKMQKLVDRTLELQDQLRSSNLAHLRVLPLMVTVRPRAELEADLPEFEKRGILVAGQEDLQAALTRTLANLDADQVFREFEQTVKNLKAKFS